MFGKIYKKESYSTMSYHDILVFLTLCFFWEHDMIVEVEINQTSNIT